MTREFASLPVLVLSSVPEVPDAALSSLLCQDLILFVHFSSASLVLVLCLETTGMFVHMLLSGVGSVQRKAVMTKLTVLTS